MSDDSTDDSPKLGLSPVQVAASALAAVSAAVFASWFGTAGTLIGAALGSVVATVGAAAYSYSLQRTAELARRTASTVRESAPTLSLPITRAAQQEVAQDAADEAAEEASRPWWSRLDPRGKGLPWVKIGAASAAVMVIAMLAITGFEGLTGRQVSISGDDSGRTTVGNVFGDGGGRQEQRDQQPADPTPTTDPTPSGSPSPTDEPSQEPSEEPSQEPSVEPSPDVSDAPVPTPSPTAPSVGATPSP